MARGKRKREATARPQRPNWMRVAGAGRGDEVIWRGARVERRRDLYHWFQRLPWSGVLGLCAGGYLAVNLVFSLLYLADPGGIANAAPGSFWDAFFFSVQTMATIGYGAMFPKSFYVNLVVTLETVVGLLTFALTTGLLFSRFSRPSARVRFSAVAVVTVHDGVPTLMFRMANERRNVILQAEVRVTLLRTERAREGTEMRRQRDLALVRRHSSFFGLSWAVMHPIDDLSPLAGETPESLAGSDTELVVLLAGVDETLSQTVYARHGYGAADILWDRRFVDILERMPDGRTVVDMGRFNDVEPDGVKA